jgi:hypothetical protein
MDWRRRWRKGVNTNERIEWIIARMEFTQETQGSAPAVAFARNELKKLKVKPKRKKTDDRE